MINPSAQTIYSFDQAFRITHIAIGKNGSYEQVRARIKNLSGQYHGHNPPDLTTGQATTSTNTNILKRSSN